MAAGWRGRPDPRRADGGRATARMDPPRWAADRGRRRRIHEGEGLLIPSRERIDGGWGRIHDGQGLLLPSRDWTDLAAAAMTH